MISMARPRLRIWGSGVRISSGAPSLSSGLVTAFCRPFRKIRFYDVLKFCDGAVGKPARPGEIFFQNLLGASQRVTCDADDLGEGAARLGKHGDRGAPNVVEVKTGNPGGLTGFRPLLRKVPLLKREPGSPARRVPVARW
jgi:hypothetical protein